MEVKKKTIQQLNKGGQDAFDAVSKASDRGRVETTHVSLASYQ